MPDFPEKIKEKIKEKKEKGKGFLLIIGGKDLRHGVGKTFLADKLASILGAQRFSTGKFFREQAREKNMNIEEFVDYVKSHPELDKKLDEKAREKVSSLLEQGKTVVADSSLLAWFLESDLNILVDASDAVRARRVYENQRKSDDSYKNPEQALEELREREEEDRERYKKLYGITTDQLNRRYDLWINNDESLERIMPRLLEKIYYHLKTQP